MLLSNVRLIPGNELVDICVSGEMISEVSRHNSNEKTGVLRIHFENAIAFPGIINSHDHLDFNNFPPLGKGNYKNYTDWGEDIHKRYKEEIDAVLKIPLVLRTAWGVYKNLLAGVTTVVNHGNTLHISNPLITIKQDSQDLHSVHFQKNWKWKLNNPFKKNKACVIHTGEGVDEKASDEIDELLKWNFLKRKLIGIHAVAMNVSQAKNFSAVVWCPESNQFLLNAMPDIKNLKDHTDILFGTDSALTGNWNIWQHLRLARDTKQVSDEQLFEMITKTPAKTWGINSGEISVGKQADIVIARTGNYLWEDLYTTDPKNILMVIHNGKIRLFDESILAQLEEAKFDSQKFNPVKIDGIIKYVEGDLSSLMIAIRSYYPKAIFPCTGYTNG